MATNFNPATKISVSGPLSISDKRSADMPLDIRGRIETLTDITTIPFAWEGMLVYVRDTKKYYKVTSLANRTVGGVAIPYYPATWVEFGSGGSTPSPTPSEIDAGDISYFSSGTFSNNTVGKELQSLASDISGLLEDIHNLSGDIGTLSSLDTEYQQDLVGAINEVLASTGSTIAVVDNLVSNSTTDALSAYQGKVLKGLVDGKVAGIKVQGGSSVLPMDGNGIVTIPAGGGEGTITGATLGESIVPEVGGVLNFPAYPADQSSRIKKIEDSIAQIGNNQPIVIPSSAVELPVSTSDPDYIDYDSDTTYVMNIDGTQVATIHYPYVDNNNNYVAFKAIDRDLYYVYSVSVVNDAERYTYSNQYTWSTLPADAKSKFESGIYAIKQVINDDGTLPEKKWYKNIPSVFVDKNNLPLRTRRINETISSSVIDVLLVKNDRLNKIYRYAFNGITNAWVLINGGCYTKDDATTGENYEKYNAYFDKKPATYISYNNALSNLNANNIQEAIDLLAANVSDNLTTLNITLRYTNGTAITNKAVSVNISFRGESHSTTGVYTTDSSGLISLSIPYGSIYSINYNDINNYQTPEPVFGSADIYTININGIYQPVSNTEKVIVTCFIRNGTSTPSGKKVYIDIYDSTGTTLITEKAFTITLNSQGLASTIIDSNNQTVNSCEVPNGNVYKVYAQPWDDTENPSYSVTGQQSFLASKYSRIVHFDYTYLNSGIFLMINNSENLTDGYDSFKVKEIDDTNNTICIIDNNDEYWIYYESGVGIKRYLSNSSIENSYLWIEDNDINNKVLGIGFRNQVLNLASDSNSAISGTCAFCMLFSSQVQSISVMWETGANISSTSATDGLYTTELYKDADHPTFAIALNYTNFKTQIGTRNQQAFIMATNQYLVLYNNFNTVKVICNAVNRVFDFMNSSSNYWTSTCNNIGSNGAQNTSGRAYSFNNNTKTLVNEPTGSSSKFFATNSYKTFPVYSY